MVEMRSANKSKVGTGLSMAARRSGEGSTIPGHPEIPPKPPICTLSEGDPDRLSSIESVGMHN